MWTEYIGAITDYRNIRVYRNPSDGKLWIAYEFKGHPEDKDYGKWSAYSREVSEAPYEVRSMAAEQIAKAQKGPPPTTDWTTIALIGVAGLAAWWLFLRK